MKFSGNQKRVSFRVKRYWNSNKMVLRLLRGIK